MSRPPEHYREMAEEMRTIADKSKDPQRAETMRKIAEDYERMERAAQRIQDAEHRLDKSDSH